VVMTKIHRKNARVNFRDGCKILITLHSLQASHVHMHATIYTLLINIFQVTVDEPIGH